MKQPIILNLFGAPGTGKSTLAAGVFAILKWDNINCELVTEYAKQKVWENHLDVLKHQIYLFGKQHYAIHKMLDKVDVIVTDAPLLMQIAYTDNPTLIQLMKEEHSKLNNINVFLKRTKPYNPSGRTQTESESDEKAIQIEDMLVEHTNQDFFRMDATMDNTQYLFNLVKERL